MPENSLVVVRSALEKLYTDACTIECTKDYQRPNGAVGQVRVIIAENEPCRISYGQGRTDMAGFAATTVETVKLFVRPELEIDPGSRVTVTRQGRSTVYSLSGPVALYPTHQEVPVTREGPS